MAEEKQMNCIFCDIVAGRAVSHKIYEDELSLCILDINPFSRGHCLAIPKRHVPWWHELTEEENASLFRVAKVVAEKMMRSLEPDFVCMYARGRRIPHTHIFLVPTYKGECWTGSSTPWSCSRSPRRSSWSYVKENPRKKRLRF